MPTRSSNRHPVSANGPRLEPQLPGFRLCPSSSARRQAPSTLSNSCHVQPGAAGSRTPAETPNFFSSFLRPQSTHIPEIWRPGPDPRPHRGMGREPLTPWAPGLEVLGPSVHRTALDLAGMRKDLRRIRLAGATCQLLLGSRPRGPRVWPDENKAGVRGDCQTGGAKTIAIKGTWEDRCAKLSLSPDVLGW